MDDLDTIRARAAAATAGPWDCRRVLGCKEIGRRVNRQTIDAVAYTPGRYDEREDRANAEFLAHARQDVVDLLELVDTLIGKRPPYHVIEFGDADEGWALQHEAGCFPDLLDCDVHAAIAEEMAQHEGPPVPPGRYRIRSDGNGAMYVAEEVDHG